RVQLIDRLNSAGRHLNQRAANSATARYRYPQVAIGTGNGAPGKVGMRAWIKGDGERGEGPIEAYADEMSVPGHGTDEGPQVAIRSNGQSVESSKVWEQCDSSLECHHADIAGRGQRAVTGVNGRNKPDISIRADGKLGQLRYCWVNGYCEIRRFPGHRNAAD